MLRHPFYFVLQLKEILEVHTRHAKSITAFVDKFNYEMHFIYF